MREKALYATDNFRNMSLLLKDSSDELFRWQVGDVVFAAWIFAIQVASVSQQFGSSNFPGVIVLHSFLCAAGLAPPIDTRFELLELERLSLGVILPSLRQRLLVIPDVLCRAGTIEE